MQNLNKPWHWWALFVQSIKCFSYKISEKLCVMTLKGDAKFKGKLTCDLKNNIRNLVNFHASSRNSENLHFDWSLLSKAYKDLDEKIQKSYFSCHWKVMQSLKKNWPLVPKVTWGIWWIFTKPFKSLKMSLRWTIFVQSIWGLSLKNTKELSKVM